MEATEINAINDEASAPRIFLPADVARVFSADFLNEATCREWILKAIHGNCGPFCPGCHDPIFGIAILSFWEGKRICCRHCGKYFTAMTRTFLGGCHLSFREIILFAVFLHFKFPARSIAKILKISPETVRLWEIKFQALSRMQKEEMKP